MNKLEICLEKCLAENTGWNSTVNDISLCITKRKPFDRLSGFENIRGDRT